MFFAVVFDKCGFGLGGLFLFIPAETIRTSCLYSNAGTDVLQGDGMIKAPLCCSVVGGVSPLVGRLSTSLGIDGKHQSVKLSLVSITGYGSGCTIGGTCRPAGTDLQDRYEGSE